MKFLAIVGAIFGSLGSLSIPTPGNHDFWLSAAAAVFGAIAIPAAARIGIPRPSDKHDRSRQS